MGYHSRFQSTLPRGSDRRKKERFFSHRHFNPRSLAGATYPPAPAGRDAAISIHAPSRERPAQAEVLSIHHISIHAPSRERPVLTSIKRRSKKFQSTLPRGSDEGGCIPGWDSIHFNPRSLAGATIYSSNKLHAPHISIHAPSRERQHQNKLLLYSFKSSIFCELAQLKYSKIYFDVRKLIVSHSSLSCEPKLNFMFHITSHRIILHYFYSCQSICK